MTTLSSGIGLVLVAAVVRCHLIGHGVVVAAPYSFTSNNPFEGLANLFDEPSQPSQPTPSAPSSTQTYQHCSGEMKRAFRKPCAYLQKLIDFIKAVDLITSQTTFNPSNPRERVQFALPRRNSADGDAIKRSLFQGINYGLANQHGELEKLLERAITLANDAIGEAPLGDAVLTLTRGGNGAGNQHANTIKMYLLNGRAALRSRIPALEQVYRRAVGQSERRGQEAFHQRVSEKLNQWNDTVRGGRKSKSKRRRGQPIQTDQNAVNVTDAVRQLENSNSPLLATAKSGSAKRRAVLKVKKWLSYLSPIKALKKIGRLFGIKAKGRPVLANGEKNGTGQ